LLPVSASRPGSQRRTSDIAIRKYVSKKHLTRIQAHEDPLLVTQGGDFNNPI
jgi:hypothetical protein